MTDETRPWWKSATGYQIYPRSFCDSNGDGIGDIRGIISKLDHLRDLGIGFIWLSPVYASPMRDNGYDISDYYGIAAEFGTLDDFDELVAQARARDIRIVMDLVVNHCSSDHDWFQKACASVGCPEHDYFYWRDAGPDGGPPDDQQSCFGGPAWIWVEAVGKYYFGFFGPQQPDLNWQNPALRAQIFDMMNWWLDRGIGGFRMDVIDLIGKDVDARRYAQGPDLHRYLKDMHRATLAGRDVMTIGESWSVTPDTALSFCGSDQSELDMVFNFNHIEAAWDETYGKWGQRRFDLVTHKRILNGWQSALAKDGWNSLFLSNHDLPRAVSYYADDGAHRVRSAKMLAMVTYLMKGTPFIYQGEEIAMTNARFTRLDQFRDIETLGQHSDQMAAGLTEAEFLRGANTNGRDNARTPMQWDATDGAGFSAGKPWIDVNENAAQINVAADRSNPDGVFAFYQSLIALRRDSRTIQDGDFTPLFENHPDVVAHLRTKGNDRILVLANFNGGTATVDRPAGLTADASLVLSNMDAPDFGGGRVTLAPYQAAAWRLPDGGEAPNVSA